MHRFRAGERGNPSPRMPHHGITYFGYVLPSTSVMETLGYIMLNARYVEWCVLVCAHKFTWLLNASWVGPHPKYCVMVGGGGAEVYVMEPLRVAAEDLYLRLRRTHLSRPRIFHDQPFAMISLIRVARVQHKSIRLITHQLPSYNSQLLSTLAECRCYFRELILLGRSGCACHRSTKVLLYGSAFFVRDIQDSMCLSCTRPAGAPRTDRGSLQNHQETSKGSYCTSLPSSSHAMVSLQISGMLRSRNRKQVGFLISVPRELISALGRQTLDQILRNRRIDQNG